MLGSDKDSSNSVFPGMTITRRNRETGVEAKTAGDADGNYLLWNVKTGDYRISGERPDSPSLRLTMCGS